jgi:chorismate dehydratase
MVAMPAALEANPTSAPHRPIAVGVVSFLNTLPLIDGLDRLANVRLRPSVPSVLIDQLVSGEVDLALCSTIDYQRSPTPLVIVPVGLLGSEGATLTVRLYSQRPLGEVDRVHVDRDSHTSIALMQILMRERFGRDPVLIEYDAREHVAENRPVDWPDAMLLIGDKVVSDSPPAVRYPHQLDLGEAWRTMTRLPFVFAAWMARADDDRPALRTAAHALDRQRRHNLERRDSIVRRFARARGWPEDLARSYVGEHLIYEWSAACRDGLGRFYERAEAHGLIDARREIVFSRW